MSRILNILPVEVHWNAVVEGITAGVVASALLAIATALRDRSRNFRLKRRIRRSVRRTGFGHNLQGVTVSVTNETGRDLTIREAVVVTDQMECILMPIGLPQSSVRRPEAKLTALQKDQLNRGEAVPIGLPQIQLGEPMARASPSDLLTITPFTKQKFLLAAELITALRGTVVGFRITLHYTAWTGDVRIFQETIDYAAQNELKGIIDHVRSELVSGNLNKARAKFGMSGVSVQENPTTDKT